MAAHKTADAEVTRALMDHLVAAFEVFAEKKGQETERGLEYIDALMGCHNFYKTVIMDLERRVNEDGALRDPTLLRRVAIDTLIMGLGLEGRYVQRV